MPIYKKYNKDFFKKWSPEMSYVLGFLFADGNLVKTNRGTYFIAFYSNDRKLLEKIKKAINSDHKISKRFSNGGRVYRIQIGSKEWFKDLGKLGLFPNKTRRMKIPRGIPNKFIGDFVRGYFDGDGNVWTGEIHKDRGRSTKTVQVAFTSCSRGFLSDLKKILNKQGLGGGSLYPGKDLNFYRLIYSVRDSLKLYKIMYKMSPTLLLMRKKKVFDQYLRGSKQSLLPLHSEKM